VLPFLVATTVAAFAAALALILSGGAFPAAAAHVALAAGIMPLIFGAMMHFVPVLTRGRPPSAWAQAIPLAMLGAGLLAAAAFLLPAFFHAGIRIAVLAGLTFALAMAVWMLRCARAALGAPHPCLRWYLAAVGCLILALLAVLAMELFPAHRTSLRLFHLHLNTLGFIGLTALGTLTVLLPTAAGQPDPDAAGRLRRDLPLAVAGVLLTAAGAAWWPPLAYAGLVLLLLPVALLGTAWVVRFPREMLRVHGAAPSLALALAGLMALLFLSVLHAQRRLAGGDAVFGFLLAFLMPLVSGAASQLLPLWLKPGVQTDWHRAARETLGRFAVLRGLTFVVAGWLVAAGWPPGAWLALAGLAAFAVQALRVAARR
jgi:hypothetical protein